MTLLRTLAVALALALLAAAPASARETTAALAPGAGKAARLAPSKDSAKTPAELQPADKQPATTAPGTVAAPPGPPQPPVPGQPVPPSIPPRPAPPPLVARLGRFDLDLPAAQLALLPELKGCAVDFTRPAGHGECVLPANEEKLARLAVAWDEGKPGGELTALRLVFDAQVAPPLTELEWQLSRAWGAPSLEQLRREREQKIFTLQWEDAEHRATLEAAGPPLQPSRAVAVVLERKPRPLTGELASLRPRPFPNMRIRLARRLDYEGSPYAVVWGTSLTPAQEALGESGPAWAQQRSYVSLWRLEPASGKRRWKALWERTSGDEEDNDQQRVLRVDTRDITGDGEPDLMVELSCPSCAGSTSEVSVKTVRAGKLVDLLSKRELFRAVVQVGATGQIRIREPEGDDGVTVSTYAYDRSKGAFVLAREERQVQARPVDER